MYDNRNKTPPNVNNIFEKMLTQRYEKS